MGFVGTWQIYTIVTSDLVKRVSDWASLTTSINTALTSLNSTLSAAVTALGPAWAPFRNVPATQDMNTFRVPGLHRISTPDTATITNLPPGMRSAALVENLITGDGTDTWWTQRVYEQGLNGRFHWRTSSDLVGGWNAWARGGDTEATITDWHVFLAVGQSNMSGRGIVSASNGGKYVQSRIFQYGYTRRVHERATVPLDMHDTSSGLSPATTFAQAYLKNQPDNVGVLIVPAAHGGTGFTNSTTTQTWTPGITTNPLYDLPGSAVTQTNAALAAATATGAAASLKGILWHQGEDNGAMSTSSYAASLDNLISYFRTQFSNPTLPFVVGQMVPEGIVANSPGRAGIDLAHQQTPGRVKYTGFAPSRTNGNNPGDTTHMSEEGVAYLGRNYMEALEQAKRNSEATITWEESPYMGRLATMYDHATAANQTLYADSGWRDVTSWFPTLTAGNVYVRRFGATVALDFQGAVFSDPAGTIPVTPTSTVPAYYRPMRNVSAVVWGINSAAARRLLVTAGGSITIYNTTAADNYYGQVTFLASGGTTAVSLPGTAAGTIPN